MTATPPPAYEAQDEQDARVVLVTVPHCQLCDKVRPIVARLAADAGLVWRELDMLREGAADPSWWDNVPIVLVDGEIAATLRVDEGGLAATLAGLR